MHRVASYVFDLDGTISDPAEGIHRSLDYALGAFGHAPIREGELSRFIGPPLDQTFSALVAGATPDHIAALVAKYRERYSDVGFAENVVYPGMPAVLRELDAAGVGLGLCTSKRADFADRILRRFGLQIVLERRHAEFDGRLLLAGDIDVAGRVIAYKHGRETRRDAVALLEIGDSIRDAVLQPGGSFLAVDDACRSHDVIQF